MLAAVRSFFEKNGALEVDCPALSKAAPIDAHIDVMQVCMPRGEIGYLHTSPEYGMKRLLSEGIGDIYQLSRVFREGEWGALHNPEFTMIEWYRLGFNFEDLIEETITVIQLFFASSSFAIGSENLGCTSYTYREVLQKFTGIDYLTISQQELAQKTLALIPHLPADCVMWDRDTLLNSLMSFIVEPHLGKEGLCIVKYFPATQAALSQITTRGDERVAERFEVYYQGIELANGYHELTCPIEQRKRFNASNLARRQMGKQELPLDENFINALEKGLPDCCGVAVGFDRLMMLRHHTTTLADILPFSWLNS